MIPKISIIIPTYNSASYIKDALDSIYNQSLKEFEVLIVDAGSKDGTKEICISYGKKFNFYDLPGSRQGEARNLGITEAEGDFVMFLDSDDVFSNPHVLNRVYLHAKSLHADFYNFSVSFFQDNKELKRISVSDSIVDSSDKLLEKALRGTDIHTIPWNKLYNRDFLLRNQIFFPDLKEQEDMVFVVLCAMKAKKSSFLNEVIVHSSVRRESLSRSMTSNNVKCCIDVFMKIEELLKSNGIYNKFDKDFNYYVMRTSSYILLMTVSRVQSNEDFLNGIKLIKELNPFALKLIFQMFFTLKPRTCFSILLSKFSFSLKFLRFFKHLKIIKGY